MNVSLAQQDFISSAIDEYCNEVLTNILDDVSISLPNISISISHPGIGEFSLGEKKLLVSVRVVTTNKDPYQFDDIIITVDSVEFCSVSKSTERIVSTLKY